VTAPAADSGGIGGGGRPHGSRARYVSGPDAGGRPGRGCRCAACTAANRAEARRRARMITYGRWQPYVDAGPAREHLRALSRAGLGRRRVAQLSGLSESALSRILHGRRGRPPARRVRPRTAAAILAIAPAADGLAPSAPVDATGTRRRLQALVATGWTQAQLAAQLGMLPGNFGAMMRRAQVTAGTARAVRQLYDRLWDQPPDPQEWRAKISASRARNHAAVSGWPPPLAWDDEAIDDPAAVPADGWQRTGRPLTPAELAADAADLITSQGYTRQHAAERLGVTKAALDKAFARSCAPAQQATTTRDQQEGSTTMFDPVPRSASEYQKGAAFAHQMFLRQHDAGVPAGQIAARHQAATATLGAAARNDGEREFLQGFADTSTGHLATLRALEAAAGQQPELEAG